MVGSDSGSPSRDMNKLRVYQTKASSLSTSESSTTRAIGPVFPGWRDSGRPADGDRIRTVDLVADEGTPGELRIAYRTWKLLGGKPDRIPAHRYS